MRGDRAEVELGHAVHAYVRSNPGQRGEQIAAALGADTKTLRGAMKRLIEEQKVRTKNERRVTTSVCGIPASEDDSVFRLASAVDLTSVRGP